MEDEVKKDEVNETVEEKTADEKEPTKKEKKDKFAKEVEKLTKEIEKAKKEAEEWKDKYYRAYADMDNTRKQNAKEYTQLIKYCSQNLAEKLIPSFEMFSTVIESSDKLPSEVQAYVMGFDMVYRQMLQALESEGVSEIKVAVGDKFDHTIHYAMETLEVDDEKMIDKVVKVLRKGYKLHDRLLKPVTVVVGKKKVTEEEKVEVSEKEKNASDSEAK